MPSLMASIKLDATGFNRGAAEVIDKTKQLGAKAAAAAKQASGTIAGVNMGRKAGLASDPKAFLESDVIAARKAKRMELLKAEEREAGLATERAMRAEERARERAAANAERQAARDAARAPIIAAKAERERERAHARARREGEREAIKEQRRQDQMRRESERAEREAEKKFSKSPMGQAAKMFAGYLTFDFVRNQAKQAIEYGGHINDLSERLGVGTTALQQWDFAAKQSGATIDDVSRFFQRLAINREKALAGNEDMIRNFGQLGVTMDDLKNKRLEDVGMQIHKSVKAGDPQKMLDDVQQVGGRSAANLMAMLASDMEGLFAQAPIIPPEAIERIDEIGDRLSEIAAVFQSKLAQGIVALADGVGVLVEGTRTAMAGVLGFIQGSVDGIVSAFRDGNIGKLLSVIEGQAGGDRAKEFVADYKEGRDLERKAAEDRKASQKATKKMMMLGGDEEGIEKAAQKKEKEAERVAKKIESLQESLAKKQDRNAMAQMDDDEKLAFLKQKRAEIAADMADPRNRDNEIFQLESANELADLDKEIASTDEQRRKDLFQRGRHQLSARQQMGGFGIGGFASSGLTYGPEQTAQNTRQKMAMHLENIEKLFKQKGQAWDSSSKTVKF